MNGLLFEARKKSQTSPNYLGHIVVGNVKVVVCGFIRKDNYGKKYLKIKEVKKND